jgi:hypothetical protein
MNPPDYICFWPKAVVRLVIHSMTAADPKRTLAVSALELA